MSGTLAWLNAIPPAFPFQESPKLALIFFCFVCLNSLIFNLILFKALRTQSNSTDSTGDIRKQGWNLTLYYILYTISMTFIISLELLFPSTFRWEIFGLKQSAGYEEFLNVLMIYAKSISCHNGNYCLTDSRITVVSESVRCPRNLKH